MLFWSLTIFQIILLILAFFMVGRVFYILITFQRAVPYVPVPRRALRRMMKVTRIKERKQKGEAIKVIDLGSGTRKMAFHLARRTMNNVEIYGIEKSALLYFFARFRRLFSPNKKRIHFICDSWDAITLESYDYVFLFLTTKGVASLYEKFARELKPSAIIVSYLFALPANTIFEEKRYDWGRRERIFVYNFPPPP